MVFYGQMYFWIGARNVFVSKVKFWRGETIYGHNRFMLKLDGKADLIGFPNATKRLFQQKSSFFK